MNKSTKLFSGYSVCFRQWKASHSHCQYLHGYSIEFRVVFQGDLDERNWVVDFGCFKTNGIKEHLNYMFDHTTIVAENDPLIEEFRSMEANKIIQLRILPEISCEKFAEYVFRYIDSKLNNRVLSVECIENKRNSAIYGPQE